MQRYSEFRPTYNDQAGLGLNGDDNDRQQWLVVPVSQTRDSGTLDQSNFAAALMLLGGESDTVEVHRFGHWGPGWFEIILVDPTDTVNVAIAERLTDQLVEYPVLDEEDWSNREFEAASEAWANMSLRDRAEVCRRFRVSIFSARRDYLPDDQGQGMVQYLADGC